MGDDVIVAVTVTSLSDEGERVPRSHPYRPMAAEQRKARESIDRWIRAIWIVRVEVEYDGGRTSLLKRPWNERTPQEGGGGGDVGGPV